MLQAVATIAAVYLSVQVLPGVTAAGDETAIAAGVLLAVMYLLLRPIARLLTKPLGCLTFGLIGTVVDAALVLLAARLIPGFAVAGFVWAAAVALVINFLRGTVRLLQRDRDDDD